MAVSANLLAQRPGPVTCVRTMLRPLAPPNRSLPRRCARLGVAGVCRAVQSDFYQVLGVGSDASLGDIKQAFRTKARRLHPDVNPQPGAEQAFMELKSAYDVLVDTSSRAEHDASLGLASARGSDPRFARFERWRSEVVPDLRALLAVWQREVDQLVTAAQVRFERLQAELAAALHLGRARCEQFQAEYEQWQARLERWGGRTGRSVGALRAELDTWVSELGSRVRSADALCARMEREVRELRVKMREALHDRFEELQARFGMYPDLVWIDEWEAASDAWSSSAETLADSWHVHLRQARSDVQSLQAQCHQLCTTLPSRLDSVERVLVASV